MTKYFIKHHTKGYYTRYHMTQDRPLFSPHRDNAEVYVHLSHALDACGMLFSDDDLEFIYIEEN